MSSPPPYLRNMARHHTKDKGDLAVAMVQADLIERGGTVLLPLTEHAPFDLVVCFGDLFFRVQVKFRSAMTGRLHVSFRSVWSDRHGVHTRPMPRDDVDVVAIYCPETRRCYYVDPVNHRSSVTIRVSPTKNGQVTGVLPAEQFLEMPLRDRGVSPFRRR